jgi:uncharacterized cofD-like protein
MRKLRVVCIGGGTGLSTLLRGIKAYCDPIAIVSMADSGGHSGQLRDELGVLPPGDVRACLVALADEDKARLLRDLFQYRFVNGSYTGANVGNLLLAALGDILGDFNKAVDAAHRLLGIRGRVIPVTLETTDLLAELEDGTILFGEKAIDLPRHNGHVRIKRVWLQPKVKANRLALRMIERADVVIVGPGDLYTSLLPNFYVTGITQAIQATEAKVLYVANIMTKHGETDGFTVDSYVSILELALARSFDGVIYNTGRVPAALVRQYVKEKAIPVAPSKVGSHWHGAPILSTASGLARHDSDKLAAILHEVITKENNARIT